MRNLFHAAVIMIGVGLIGSAYGYLFGWRPVQTLLATVATLLIVDFALRHVDVDWRD